MAYYRICRYCGANLDPGERCTCREEKEEREKQKREKAAFEKAVVIYPTRKGA